MSGLLLAVTMGGLESGLQILRRVSIVVYRQHMSTVALIYRNDPRESKALRNQAIGDLSSLYTLLKQVDRTTCFHTVPTLDVSAFQ